MKSGLRRLANQNRKPPVALGGSSTFLRGRSFNLGAGRQDKEMYLRQFGLSGTLFSIVSLMAESAASPEWHLYKKPPLDGRRRYTTGDQGSDQRTEVVQHPAIKLWKSPNDFHSGFEFREGGWQHQELTGETFWVMDIEMGFPTAMWYVRPDRMEPEFDTEGSLNGWMYTGPNGENVPFTSDEVILEKRPDPLDPFRGAGPVASLVPNIQQQRYATEYQRNLFLNGADPGGVITVPNNLNDREYDKLIDRWRESHRGVARAGHVGVLEAGMMWTANPSTNKDMEYTNLRLNNRDELREGWRVHKAMMGTSDDVNRADAQTAEEVFVAWQVLTRLNRRRDTLNNKLLPKYADGSTVEFDYEDPSPTNAETAANELLSKAQALQALIDAGCDLSEALETVGLPAMSAALLPPAPLPKKSETPAISPNSAEKVGSETSFENFWVSVMNGRDAAAKVFEQEADDFPASAMSWMHDAVWKGPVKVPLAHIDWTPSGMDGVDPDHVQEFVKELQDGSKVKPVILVKTPGKQKLQLADGHHRYLAYAELKKPVKAFIGVVNQDHGGWEGMHRKQYGTGGRGSNEEMAALLRRVLSNGYVPVQVGSR